MAEQRLYQFNAMPHHKLVIGDPSDPNCKVYSGGARFLCDPAVAATLLNVSEVEQVEPSVEPLSDPQTTGSELDVDLSDLSDPNEPNDLSDDASETAFQDDQADVEPDVEPESEPGRTWPR